MPVWGVINQKGGVGKTTTAVNLAAGLAKRGKKTLLIDCDPQGNATTGLGIEKPHIQATLFDVFTEVIATLEPGDALRKAIHPVGDQLDAVPATLDLAGAEALLLNAVGKEMILRDALESVREDYEWIICDAPPSLGLLTINILGGVDRVVVPMQCEFYALEGLSQLVRTVDLVRRRINPDLAIAKVLLTMVDSRNKLSQQVSGEVQAYFKDKVSKIVIPRNVRLSEAPSYGEPAIQLFPTSKGAQAYQSFVDEVLRECVEH